MEKPLQAVLMDLDGTTVHSEHFWIWIIEKTTASLLGNPKFELEGLMNPMFLVILFRSICIIVSINIALKNQLRICAACIFNIQILR